MIRVLGEFGFEVVALRGSHAKLRRMPDQILTVPVHAEIAPGTLRAIIRQASRFVPQRELRARFYR
ncbi:MAG TPA: type II toxin-antitoxin system HicA family toxin [Candidatus Polarisedimenticolaceae bacterium]|nr:type II toxin-antitoxin system HicA family toxin [Candidatus Polarisedimenticolaceae bacterium]